MSLGTTTQLPFHSANLATSVSCKWQGTSTMSPSGYATGSNAAHIRVLHKHRSSLSSPAFPLNPLYCSVSEIHVLSLLVCCDLDKSFSLSKTVNCRPCTSAFWFACKHVVVNTRFCNLSAQHWTTNRRMLLRRPREWCEVLRSACVLCLSVRSLMSKPYVQTSRNFLYTLPVAVDRSYSDMQYVLPVFGHHVFT